ncbi:MAG TPA: Uma2 family endonuclease [Tepidisphaeraceae bacterium]|jgi:Uma2 family endonuclease|nr:Uma2 family endonuclease [Tepidisphaeraceae bacterium]
MTQQLKHSAGPSTLSYEEFLEWDGENQHVEWVDGKAVEMAPVGDLEQDLKGFLLSVMRTFVNYYDLGVVRDDPFQMKTGPDLPGRAPDIMFVAKANSSRIRKSHLDGPADLVVEISAPGSRRVDRHDKFSEYEQGGVQEYWLLDAQRRRAEFYHRGIDAKFHLLAAKDDGTFHSIMIAGLWIRLEWLWQKPLPSEIAVLKEWGLVK